MATSLALQIGHRISVDLDFFGDSQIEHDLILDLIGDLGVINILTQSKNILILNLNGIKVDFVKYRYKPLQNPIVIDGIRLFSQSDIAAMKLAAIIGRGRKRDFIDLYFLMRTFELEALVFAYKQKYPDGSEFLLAKSLTYFDDAEEDETPKMLVETDWNEVKSTIQKEVGKLYQ